MKRIVTLLPTHRNDGSEVTRAERTAILERFWSEFPGVTTEGVVEGHWIDPQDQHLYHDHSIKVVVIVPDDQVEIARQLVREIRIQLDQIVMYFEVSDVDFEYLD